MLTELQNLSSHHFAEGLKYFLLAPQPVQQHGKFSRHSHHRTLLHRAAVLRVLERPLTQGAVRTVTFQQDMRALHQQTPEVPVTALADGQVRILLAALPALWNESQKRSPFGQNIHAARE